MTSEGEGSGLIRGRERAIRHRTKGGEGVGVGESATAVGESSDYSIWNNVV